MRRLTTPTHTFTLPINADLVDKFLLTYTQDGKIILEKNRDDMSVNGNVWSVKLTQEETKLFAEDVARAQIRILTTGGDALASDKMRFYVDGVFNEEVLT